MLGWFGVPEFTLIYFLNPQLIIQIVYLSHVNVDQSNDFVIDFEIFVPNLSNIFSNLIGGFWEKIRDWLVTSSFEILIS